MDYEVLVSTIRAFRGYGFSYDGEHGKRGKTQTERERKDKNEECNCWEIIRTNEKERKTGNKWRNK